MNAPLGMVSIIHPMGHLSNLLLVLIHFIHNTTVFLCETLYDSFSLRSIYDHMQSTLENITNEIFADSFLAVPFYTLFYENKVYKNFEAQNRII